MAFDWDNEATSAAYRSLYKEGFSLGEIGRRLGVSKNAVVGKTKRLIAAGKLPKRKHTHLNGAAQGKAYSPKIREASKIVRLKKPKSSVLLGCDRNLPPATPQPGARVCAWVDEGAPIGRFMRLWTYCDQQATKGAYCQKHSEGLYITPAPLRPNERLY